jgi:hypothetical protein
MTRTQPDAQPIESIDEIAEVTNVEVVSEDEVSADSLLSYKTFPPVTAKGIDRRHMKRTSKNRSDKAVILQMFLHGYDVNAVAAILGQDKEWITSLLYEAMRECAPSAKVDELRSIELQKLDLRERAAWEDYEKSGMDEVITTAKEGADGVKTTTRTKPRPRNPAFQKVLNDISVRRAQLTGIDRPHKVQIAEKRQLHIIETVVTSRQDVEKLEQMKNAGLLK